VIWARAREAGRHRKNGSDMGLESAVSA
jgi:hypothetical protein